MNSLLSLDFLSRIVQYLRLDYIGLLNRSRGYTFEKDVVVTLQLVSVLTILVGSQVVWNSPFGWNPLNREDTSLAFYGLLLVLVSLIPLIVTSIAVWLATKRWLVHFIVNITLCSTIVAFIILAFFSILASNTGQFSTDRYLVMRGEGEATALYGQTCGDLGREIEKLWINKRTTQRSERSLNDSEVILRNTRQLQELGPPSVENFGAALPILKAGMAAVENSLPRIKQDLKEFQSDQERMSQIDKESDLAKAKFEKEYNATSIIQYLLKVVLALNAFYLRHHL